MVNRYEPIQIMPAQPGWEAYYREENGEDSPRGEGDEVLMWALCACRVAEGRLELPNEILPIINTDDIGLDVAANASNYRGVRLTKSL